MEQRYYINIMTIFAKDQITILSLLDQKLCTFTVLLDYGEYIKHSTGFQVFSLKCRLF